MAALAILAACGKKTETPATPETESIPVRTVVVGQESLVIPIHASGLVRSLQEARPAFKTGGVIKRIFAEEGDAVLKGQLLATLNLTEINSQVTQAREAVDKARRHLQRVRNLFADSVATLEQVQNATTGLRMAEEGLTIATFNQHYSEVRAPIDGKVIRKLMSEGEVAGPGMPVFYIQGNNKEDWVVKAGLSDRDWARLKIGDPAQVTLDAFPGQVFPAKVHELAEVINPQSGTFDVELKLLTKPARLATGLVASVDISPASEGTFAIIPLDALVESNGREATVFVLQPDQTVKRTAIAIGHLQGNKVAITRGLKPGAVVVTDGAPYLENGSKVSVVN